MSERRVHPPLVIETAYVAITPRTTSRKTDLERPSRTDTVPR